MVFLKAKTRVFRFLEEFSPKHLLSLAMLIKGYPKTESKALRECLISHPGIPMQAKHPIII
jgi:hypothetical protein